MQKLTNKEYSQKILELSRRDFEESDKPLVEAAANAYIQSDYEKLDEILEKLGDDYKLLETLITKLKGKSVYNGLKNLTEGKDQSNEQAIISTASLISHVAIESRADNKYRRLLPDLYRKLGVLINGI